jgi:elongation factor Ts
MSDNNTTEKIQSLRKLTGASIQECKKCLEENDWSEDKAAVALRKKGLLFAAKKQERTTKTGVVEVYVHPNKKLAAMVEVRCETDFVAKSEEFQKFGHEIAMQLAAMRPSYIKPSDVPTEILEDLKAIFRREFENVKKPANIVEQIIEGKIAKRLEEICLLKQPYVKDNDMTIEDLMKGTIAKFGENIEIARFHIIEI